MTGGQLQPQTLLSHFTLTPLLPHIVMAVRGHVHDGGVSLENMLGAVAMVDVPVHDEDAMCT